MSQQAGGPGMLWARILGLKTSGHQCPGRVDVSVQGNIRRGENDVLSQAGRQEGIPSPYLGEGQSLFLLRPPTDGMRPTHT